MLLGTLRVMGEAVPNDQGAVIYPEAHAAAGQDQRLMGLSRRSAKSALVGALLSQLAERSAQAKSSGASGLRNASLGILIIAVA